MNKPHEWRAAAGALLAILLLVAGCAAAPPAGGPKSPTQLKQQELEGMEKSGQRNDFDKMLPSGGPQPGQPR